MAALGQDARYRIRRRLASGGMSDVTLAEDTVLGRPVALKRLRSTGDPDAVARLRREALVGASLSHPNLVSVYDVWEDEHGDLVIVMEYVAGETLRDLIRGAGALPPEQALPILTGVAAALDAVHARGVVHRDVKPANILVGHAGEVKLADLGIAASRDHTRITTSGEVVGTFRYMAPEQLEGHPSAPAMDIYAFAAVAFEALSGKPARPEPNPLALAHAIASGPPPDLRAHVPAPATAAAVLQRGMAADPTARPRSASELIGRLRAAYEPATTEADAVAEIMAAAVADPAPRPSPPPIIRSPTTEPGRRRPAALGWAAVALLVLLAGAVTAIVVTSGSDSSSPMRAASAPHTRSTAHTRSATQRQSTSTSRTTSTAAAAPPARTTTQTSTAASRPAPATSTPAASAGTSGTPAAAVTAFYERAASHDYAGAWALADDAMRAQLGGYVSFRSQMNRVRAITFHEAQAASGASPATVTVRTTSMLADRTENCSGTARSVRSGTAGGWLLDGISISCTPA